MSLIEPAPFTEPYTEAEKDWIAINGTPANTSAEADSLVALTMTPDAGQAFWKALMYAANRIPREARTDGAEMSHEDWLRWGASRLDAAIRAAAANAETERQPVSST